MKKIIISGIFFLLMFNFVLAQDKKAKAILDATKAYYQSMNAFKANFVYNLSSPTTGTNETVEGEITIKKEKFYLKLPAQHIITDAKTQWTYLKSSNEVNITDYSPDADEITPNKIYSLYETKYDYVYVEEKTEQGKTYHIIELKPKDFKTSKVTKVRLKIVKTTNAIKSWEVFERNQNRYLYNVTRFAKVRVEDNYFKYNRSNYPSKPQEVDLR
jgi:hypothetical protein